MQLASSHLISLGKGLEAISSKIFELEDRWKKIAVEKTIFEFYWFLGSHGDVFYATTNQLYVLPNEYAPIYVLPN